MKQLLFSTAVIVALASFAPAPAHAQRGPAGAVDQVRAAETAFAKSMADRNATAFRSLIAEEAVFFGGKTVQHGKPEVVAAWKRFFDGAAAPFSWAPAEVEVLASGTLGMTSGPVYDPNGQRIGTFNSIWQKQKDGSWQIIFDKGCPPCECGTK